MPSSLGRTRQLGLLVALLALILGVAVLRSAQVEAGTSFNEGLESLNAAGTVPQGWWQAGYGTNTASWYLDRAPHGGQVSQGLRVTNWRSGDRKLLTSQTGSGLPVVAGRTYDLSGWYRTDGTTSFVVYRRTSNGSWSYWTSSRVLAKSGSWVKGSFTTPTVPSGTTGLSFGIALASNGTLATDDYNFAEHGATSTTTSTTSTPVPAPSGGAVLVADGFDRPHRVALITDQRIGLSADHVRCALRRAGMGGLVVPWGADIAVVLTESGGDERILESINQVVPGGQPVMGVSSVKCEGHDLSVAVSEANVAQTLLRASRTSSHVNFEDVGVFRLFASEENWRQLEAFVRDSIGELVEYDFAHGSELVQTLDAYLSRVGSLNHLCEDLAIHRSTLVYRLGRIRDLLGVDIDESNRRLELLLAARAVEVLHAVSGSFVRGR